MRVVLEREDEAKLKYLTSIMGAQKNIWQVHIFKSVAFFFFFMKGKAAKALVIEAMLVYWLS